MTLGREAIGIENRQAAPRGNARLSSPQCPADRSHFLSIYRVFKLKIRFTGGWWVGSVNPLEYTI